MGPFRTQEIIYMCYSKGEQWRLEMFFLLLRPNILESFLIPLFLAFPRSKPSGEALGSAFRMSQNPVNSHHPHCNGPAPSHPPPSYRLLYVSTQFPGFCPWTPWVYSHCSPNDSAKMWVMWCNSLTESISMTSLITPDKAQILAVAPLDTDTHTHTHTYIHTRTDPGTSDLISYHDLFAHCASLNFLRQTGHTPTFEALHFLLFGMLFLQKSEDLCSNASLFRDAFCGSHGKTINVLHSQGLPCSCFPRSTYSV